MYVRNTHVCMYACVHVRQCSLVHPSFASLQSFLTRHGSPFCGHKVVSSQLPCLFGCGVWLSTRAASSSSVEYYLLVNLSFLFLLLLESVLEREATPRKIHSSERETTLYVARVTPWSYNNYPVSRIEVAKRATIINFDNKQAIKQLTA